MSVKALAERMGIRSIDCPDGTRLSPLAGGLTIDASDGALVTVTVRYGWFGPEPKPANTEQAGGYIVPTELAEATRDEAPLVRAPVAVRVEPDVSDWIDSSVKPTIIGWYQRNYTPWMPDETVLYAFWNGTAWGTSRLKPDQAPNSFQASIADDLPWRGLRHYPAPTEGHAS